MQENQQKFCFSCGLMTNDEVLISHLYDEIMIDKQTLAQT
jgi:hypothetical protein